MSLQVPARRNIFDPEPPPPVRKRKFKMPGVKAIAILAGVFVLFGTGGWYYFFGRKPKVALSVPVSAKGMDSASGLWTVGVSQLLLVADGQAKLVSTGDRKVKWSAKIPPSPSVEPEWQSAINARFVKLQQWADELGRKRATLTKPGAIKDFNAEAARYHAELNAARADAAKPRAIAAQAPPQQTDANAADASFGNRAGLDKLHEIVSPEVRILEDRVKKRAAKLGAWKASLDAKKANAKTDFQKAAAKEEEARYEAEAAEQKKDEGDLQKAQGAPAPKATEDEKPDPAIEMESDTPNIRVAVSGSQIWVVERRHAVAFDRDTGGVKADVPLAGPVTDVFQGTNTVIVVASAGAEASHVTRLSQGAPPQSSYFPVGRREEAFQAVDGGMAPNVQNHRTEFSAASDSLLRVDIRLKQKKIKARDSIKKSSEKELEATAANSAAHSEDELKAITALIANDAAKLMGDGLERVDESTYEIALSRPFDANAAGWTGTLQGRVQVFSTPTIDLVTAGTKLLAFDRSNRKLWEGTLGAPVPITRVDDESDRFAPPWLESGDKLFFADGAFLTAFQAKTGQVLWRVPSVGIRKLQIDGDGNLYVLSDNLNVEVLTYATDESLRDSIPVTMKINTGDGKIAWNVDKYQDLWVSGKDVYVLRETKNAADIETQVFDRSKAIEARVKIYKLRRGSGTPLWEWFQPRRPRGVEVDHKYVALLFGDELQLIHSICW